jgi:large subunit ribosomal protein L10
MATKQRKEEIVGELTHLFTNGKIAIVTDLSGFTVAELTDFRRQLRVQNSKCQIAKNTLLKIATAQGEFGALKEICIGPTAVVVGYDDPVTTAKLAVKFLDSLNKGAIRGGIIDGALLDSDQIKSLSKLPSREVLIAGIMGGLDSGARSIAGMMEAVMRDLALCIEEVAKKQQAA